MKKTYSTNQSQKIKSKSRYTEGWIPIKSIENGTIVLDNKLRVTGVKIQPRNIFILDQVTQDNIIIALKNFYNTIDFEFWLISADRPVDIAGYIAKLQLLHSETHNQAIKKLIAQDIEKATDFTDNNVTDTEYFILFKDKNSEIIQKKMRTLITGLANCGLKASQTSNDDLRVLMDNFLNGGETTNFRTAVVDI